MSRSVYGFHRAVGGMDKRRHDALAAVLDGQFCQLKTCGRPAVGIVENWAGQPFPICAEHIPGARDRGYAVYLPEGDPT